MAIANPTQSKFAKAREPYYPVSDGEPMAETDLHWEVTAYSKYSMQTLFAPRSDVYVGSDNFLYFAKGNPRAVVSPDCYVVFGVAGHLRDTFKTWEEDGHTPDFVLEITSKKTRKEDVGHKLQIYQDTLRVAEYFLFDPTADYIRTRLTGYRMGATGYVPVLPNSDGCLFSEQLGVELRVEGDRLRFYDPTMGKLILTDREVRVLAEQETQRANEEARRAETETQRANEEAQRANEEARARVEVEVENARLRAELAALRQQYSSPQARQE